MAVIVKSPDLEQTLLAVLGRVDPGSPDTQMQASQLIQSITARDCKLLAPHVRILCSALDFSRAKKYEDLSIVVSFALGKLAQNGYLGDNEEAVVKALKAAALEDRESVFTSALHALVKCPPDRAGDCFVEIAQSWLAAGGRSEQVDGVLVPLFLQIVNARPEAWKRFNEAIAPAYQQDSEQAVRDLLLSGLDDRPLALDLSRVTLPIRLGLDGGGALLDPQCERLPKDIGKTISRMVPVLLGDNSLSVQVDVHNARGADGVVKPVVALELREATPLAWSHDQTMCMVASLVREKFDLPPEDTIWLDRSWVDPLTARLSTRQLDLVFFEMLGRYGNLRTSTEFSIDYR
jgi:hypothetical protein